MFYGIEKLPSMKIENKKSFDDHVSVSSLLDMDICIPYSYSYKLLMKYLLNLNIDADIDDINIQLSVYGLRYGSLHIRKMITYLNGIFIQLYKFNLCCFFGRVNFQLIKFI